MKHTRVFSTQKTKNVRNPPRKSICQLRGQHEIYMRSFNLKASIFQKIYVNTMKSSKRIESALPSQKHRRQKELLSLLN